MRAAMQFQQMKNQSNSTARSSGTRALLLIRATKRSAALLAQLALAAPASAATLEVTVANIGSTAGALEVSLYRDPETWLSPRTRFATRRIAADTHSEGRVTAVFDVPAGTYAVAAYHDANGNGRMDYRLLRLPKEPYAFGNNARPVFSAPSFEDAAVVVGPEGAAIVIDLTD